ncbi:hypothetical protein B4065_2557 [Caldibacillus thermoamylovorans]|nr:hypothetical protein B4065_2557 [Caldibacillus thermoamylovorans]
MLRTIVIPPIRMLFTVLVAGNNKFTYNGIEFLTNHVKLNRKK